MGNRGEVKKMYTTPYIVSSEVEGVEDESCIDEETAHIIVTLLFSAG